MIHAIVSYVLMNKAVMWKVESKRNKVKYLLDETSKLNVKVTVSASGGKFGCKRKYATDQEKIEVRIYNRLSTNVEFVPKKRRRRLRLRRLR